MKQTKYKIVFQSGEETEVYAFGIHDAVILASAWAIKKALDRTIKEVYDENGKLFKPDEVTIKVGN